MAVRTRVGTTTAIRGPALTYTGDAFAEGLERTMRYEPDAIVAMAGGKVPHVGTRGRGAPAVAARRQGPALRQGQPDPRRLRRLPCALSPDADYRRLWRAAHRLADAVHLSRRGGVRGRRARARGREGG